MSLAKWPCDKASYLDRAGGVLPGLVGTPM